MRDGGQRRFYVAAGTRVFKANRYFAADKLQFRDWTKHYQTVSDTATIVKADQNPADVSWTLTLDKPVFFTQNYRSSGVLQY